MRKLAAIVVAVLAFVGCAHVPHGTVTLAPPAHRLGSTEFVTQGPVSAAAISSAVTGTGFWHSTSGTLDSASSEPLRLITGTTNATLGSGTYTLTLSGVTAAQLGAASTDFTAYGASPAQSGTLRFQHSSGTNLITTRNNGGSADDTILNVGGNSNGEETSLEGSQWAAVTYTSGPVATAPYFLVLQSNLSSIIGGTNIYFTKNAYQNVSTSLYLAQISGSSSGDTGTGAFTFGPSLTSGTFTAGALASTSGGSGAAGYTVTLSAQAGQAATGASNNGGAGGALVLSSGAGGTSGSATAGAVGALMLQVGGTTQEAWSSSGHQLTSTSVAITAGGTITLTQPQYQNGLIRLTGTPASSTTVVLPNSAGVWFFSVSQVTLGVNTLTFQSGSATTSAISSLTGTSQILMVSTYGGNTIDLNN